jgi:integrase
MAAVNLTATRIDRIKYDSNGSKIQRTWDTEVAGLGVEVFLSGRKAWIFRYRLHGKQRIITLARVSDLSLDDARSTGVEYRAIVRSGADPKVTRDAPVDGMTLDQLYQKYVATRYFKSRSEDFHANLASTYNRYLKPDLGYYPLQSIQRSQVRGLVEGLIEQGKEGAARGLLNRTRILFNYALQLELVENSPADHIRPRYSTKGRRTEWLDTNEKLKEAWWFPGAPQTRALIRWCLLTGCRRDEARTTRYAWITDDTWRVPETKNSRELVLPMMPAMQQVVDEMRSTFGATHWLFPATTDTQKVLPRGTLDYMIRQGAKKTWSLHTLRHTVKWEGK